MVNKFIFISMMVSFAQSLMAGEGATNFRDDMIQQKANTVLGIDEAAAVRGSINNEINTGCNPIDIAPPTVSVCPAPTAATTSTVPATLVMAPIIPSNCVTQTIFNQMAETARIKREVCAGLFGKQTAITGKVDEMQRSINPSSDLEKNICQTAASGCGLPSDLSNFPALLAQQDLRVAASLGFIFDPRNGTFEDTVLKKKFNIRQFDSEKNMRRAGLSQQDIDAIMLMQKNILNDIQSNGFSKKFSKLFNTMIYNNQNNLPVNQLKKHNLNQDGSSDVSSSEYSDYAFLSSAENERRRIAAISMFIKFRGDPIGVSNDNIWKMMTKRYNEKERSNFFLNQ